mgnify:CR=1 FL=1
MKGQKKVANVKKATKKAATKVKRTAKKAAREIRRVCDVLKRVLCMVNLSSLGVCGLFRTGRGLSNYSRDTGHGTLGSVELWCN